MNEIGKVSIKLIADTSTFFSDVKKAVSQLENQKPKVAIAADVSALQASITKALSSISQLKSTTIGISADDSKLQNSVSKSLSGLSSLKSTSVAINVDDVQAISAVDAVKRRLDLLQSRADKLAISPKVDDSQLKALELQIGTTKSRLEKLEPSFLNSAFTNFGNIASGSITKLKVGIEDLAKSTTTFATLLTGGITAGLVGLGTSGVKTAADLSTIKTSLTVLTGSAETATRIFKDTYEQSLISPNTFEDIASARKTLIGFGSTVDDSKGQISTLLDVAGATGADFSRLALVFGQVNAAGKLMGGDALQLINNNLPISTILSKKLGITIKEVQERMSDGAISSQIFNEALKEVTQEGGFAFNGALKQSKTLTGQFSTLSDGITSLGLRFVGFGVDGELATGGIADTVLKLVDSLNFGTTISNLGLLFGNLGTKVSKVFTNIFSSFDIGNIDFTNISNAISSAFDSVVQGATETIKVIQNVFKYIVDSVGGFENLIKILQITAITVGTLAVAFGILSVATSPITLAILVIEGAIIGLAAILGNGDIGKGLDKILDGFKATFGFIQNIFSGGNTFLTPLIDGIKDLYSQLSKNAFVIDAIESIKDIIDSLVNTSVMQFEAISTVVRFLWDDLGIGEVVINGIIDLFEIIGATIYVVIKAVQFLANGFENMAKAGSENVEKLYNAFKPFTEILDTGKFLFGLINTTRDLETITVSVNDSSKNLTDSIVQIGPPLLDMSDKAKLGALGLKDLHDANISAEDSTKNLDEAIKGLDKTFENIEDKILSSSEAIIRKAEADIRVTKTQKDYDNEVKISGALSAKSIDLFNKLTRAKIDDERSTRNLEKSTKDIISSTDGFIEQLQKQPGLIDAVKLADIQKQIVLIENAQALASKNGENLTGLEAQRQKLIELTNTPANITVNADTTLADIATNRLKEKVANSGGTINVNANTGTATSQVESFVSFVAGKVATIPIGLQNPNLSVVDNIIANLQRNLNSRSLSIPLQNFSSTTSVGGLSGFKFATGGEVPKYLASGGFGSKGTDTVPAMLTPGEYVVNQESANRFSGILESINKTPDRFGEYIRNIGRLGNNTNITSETKNNNINVSIGTIQGSTNQIQKNVNNIGFLLQSELLNRGIL